MMKMTAEQLMEGIRLPEEGRDIVRMYPLKEETYQHWKTLFATDTDLFLKLIQREENKEQLLLCLYIRMAAEEYQAFLCEGLTERTYLDTFYDLTIWYRKCTETQGVRGLIQGEWLSLPILHKVYRLGRLQYQADGEAIHIHIPEGEPLSPEKCLQSLAQARDFYGDRYSYYDCDSWLLAPALKKLLDSDSNILKFQKLFTIRECDSDYSTYRHAEERIFGFISDEPSSYPEHTTLQRRAKDLLLSGGSIGAGYGRLRPLSPDSQSVVK